MHTLVPFMLPIHVFIHRPPVVDLLFFGCFAGRILKGYYYYPSMPSELTYSRVVIAAAMRIAYHAKESNSGNDLIGHDE